MSEKSAFLDGFRKGLFSPFSLEPIKEEIGLFESSKVERTKLSTWEDSWNKIGKDMYKALDYVAEKSKQT